LTTVERVLRSPGCSFAVPAPIADVAVWAVDLDQDPPSLTTVDDLEPAERARADRFVRRVDRQRFLRRRLELRRRLGAEIGCPAGEIRFAAGPHGKPSVGWPPTDLHFSTTSTESLMLIAIARVPVGIDCERVRADRVSSAGAQIFLTGREFDAWSGLRWPSRILAFFVAWTRKEASVKSSGLGLGGCPPNRLDVTFEPPAKLATFVPRQGFIASLATEADPR
jgi:4'-phosphopantetheinyl transferase